MNPILASSVDFDAYLENKKRSIGVLGPELSVSGRKASSGRKEGSMLPKGRAVPDMPSSRVDKDITGKRIMHKWGLHVKSENSGPKVAPSSSSSRREGGLDIDTISRGDVTEGTARSPPRPIWSSSVYKEPYDLNFLDQGPRPTPRMFPRNGGDRDTLSPARAVSGGGSADLEEEYRRKSYMSYLQRHNLEPEGGSDDLPPAWSPPRQRSRGPTTSMLCRSMDEREAKAAKFLSRRKNEMLGRYMHLWRRGTWLSKQAHVDRDRELDMLGMRVRTRRLRGALQSWHQHSRVARFRRGVERMWLARSLAKMREYSASMQQQYRLAEAYADQRNMERSLGHWVRINRERRARERLHVLGHIAHEFHAQALTRKVFRQWSSSSRAARDLSQMEVEQQERRTRIACFLANVQAKNAAPAAPPNTPAVKQGIVEAFGEQQSHPVRRKSGVPRQMPGLDRDKLAAAAAARRAKQQEEERARHDALRKREREREIRLQEEMGKLEDISVSERAERQRWLRRQASERVSKKREADREQEEKRVAEEEDRELARARARRRDEVGAQRAFRERRDAAVQRKDERRQKLVASVQHFRRDNLLVRWGLAPWQQLLSLRREQEMAAVQFRAERLLTASFLAYKGHFYAEKRARKRREHAASHMAGAHFKAQLLRNHFRAWMLHRRMLKAKAKAVTGAFSRFSHLRRGWKGWLLAQQRVQRRRALEMRRFGRRGDRLVLKHFYKKWVRAHEDGVIEREAAARANETWSKVQSWLK